MKQKIRQNFIYPTLNEKNHQYGASILLAPILRPDADWRTFTPPYEAQQRKGLEPSSCFIEAQQHTIASIHEQKLLEVDNNWSARFNALLAGGTPTGGDPVVGGDSIRHDGLIAEDLMNYDGLTSWDDFHSWKGVNESRCRSAGQADLYLYDRHFGVIINRGMSLKTKYQVLREGLKRSPVPMSVYGLSDGRGSYVEKPEGVSDTHMVEALYVSPENKITILDTYEPFIKELPANYEMDFGVVWTVEKKSPQNKNWLLDLYSRLLQACKELLTLDLQLLKQIEPADVFDLEKEPPTPNPDVVPYVAPAVTKLKEITLASLGKDLSKKAPNEVGCADSLSTVLQGVFKDFPRFLSTSALKSHLDADKRFLRCEAEPWTVIVSPTVGKNIGHTGVYGKDGVIYSNNSKTGLWSSHWTLDKWIAYYRTKKGLKVYFYKIV